MSSRKREYYYNSNGDRIAVYEGQEVTENLTKETPKEIHEKYSKQLSGEGNPMYGKNQKDSTKSLISEKAKGRNVGEKNGAFGRKWCTDGIVKSYIKGELPPTFYYGCKEKIPYIKEETLNEYLQNKGISI